MDVKTYHIFLIHDREFRKTGEKIYRLGKCARYNLNRSLTYPNGSTPILQVVCNDLTGKRIDELINKFKENFIHRLDIGKGYYEGDYVKMMDMIYSFAKDQGVVDDTVYFFPDKSELNSQSVPCKEEGDEDDFIPITEKGKVVKVRSKRKKTETDIPESKLIDVPQPKLASE